ncbi:MAG: hypothetical protein ABI967_05020 [bacterium]
MKLIYVFLIAAICLLGTTFAQTASKQRLVGNLRNKRLVDGCGCYFQFPGSKKNSEDYLFVSSLEENEKTAWMNIDGRDVKLRLVREVAGKGRERVGSRSSKSFTGGDVTVMSTYVATRVCAYNDESCEATDYAAIFVVRKSNRVQTVKAVGGCGC